MEKAEELREINMVKDTQHRSYKNSKEENTVKTERTFILRYWYCWEF